MHRSAIVLAVVGLMSLTSAVAERAILPVTRDVGITSVVGKQTFSNGAGPSAALRQNQNWSGFENKTLLMAFDTSLIKGWTIDKAYLHLTMARGELYGAGLCTVLAPWVEGKGKNYLPQAGASCWDYARRPASGARATDANYWAGPGSKLFTVAWGHPHIRYSHARGAQLKRGRTPDGRYATLRIAVKPELVAALATGACYGLILTDDKGQVAEGYSLLGTAKPYRYSASGDIWVFTRESQDATLRPRLEVIGRLVDKTPPAKPAGLKVSSVSPSEGRVTLSFIAPGDDGVKGTALAYDVTYVALPGSGADSKKRNLPRWSLPLPVPGGAEQKLPIFTLESGSYRISIRGVDEAGNRSAAAVTTITIPPKPDASLVAGPSRDAPDMKTSLPGEAEGKLSLYACADMVKIDPITGAILGDGRNRMSRTFALRNHVWDAAARRVSLQAAANEVVAFQLILKKGAADLTGLRVSVSDLSSAGGETIRSAKNFETFRIWYILSEKPQIDTSVISAQLHAAIGKSGWHGDACLPLQAPFDESFSLPAADNKIPSQQYQSVWVDMYIPRGTKAGTYTGSVQIRADQLARPLTVATTVKVLPLALPDKVTWQVELNRYGSITGYAGADASQALEAEKLYRQLARKHRATINMVAYSQSGKPKRNFAPVLTGVGTGVRIADWTAWDERFGPLLDGSAFSAQAGYVGPGADMPITHMYVPFNEDWPVKLSKKTYRDFAELKGRMEFTEWAKTSRRLEEAFTSQYKETFARIVSEYFKHLKDKGWTGTSQHFYFNNKYYYKCGFFGPRTNRGSSFWLLDEPIDYDDYAANRFFLSLARRGVEQAGAPQVPVEYRTDVSTPSMVRALWNDDVCTLWSSSGMRRYGPTSQIRAKWIDNDFWCYGNGPAITTGPVAILHRLLWSWSFGTVGDMPYWNFGSKNWDQRKDLHVIYSGDKYAGGSRSYLGGIAGVRLKALRRCQQDFEYLNLLAQCEGWDRHRVRSALAARSDDPKAHTLYYTRMTSSDWADLREAIVATILANK